MGAENAGKGQYTIDCEKRGLLPNISFIFSGYDFSIRPEDYIFEMEGSCISALIGVDLPPGGPLVVLGYAFLRQWYSVFDLGANSISFAKSRQVRSGGLEKKMRSEL
jgi:saccharopepsin